MSTRVGCLSPVKEGKTVLNQRKKHVVDFNFLRQKHPFPDFDYGKFWSGLTRHMNKIHSHAHTIQCSPLSMGISNPSIDTSRMLMYWNVQFLEAKKCRKIEMKFIDADSFRFRHFSFIRRTHHKRLFIFFTSRVVFSPPPSPPPCCKSILRTADDWRTYKKSGSAGWCACARVVWQHNSENKWWMLDSRPGPPKIRCDECQPERGWWVARRKHVERQATEASISWENILKMGASGWDLRSKNISKNLMRLWCGIWMCVKWAVTWRRDNGEWWAARKKK